MSLVYEVVHSRVRADREEEMLALRPAMIEAVRARFPGLLDAQLVRLDDGTWLDIVTWQSREDAEAAAAAFAAVPEAARMSELVEEVLSFQHGVPAEAPSETAA